MRFFFSQLGFVIDRSVTAKYGYSTDITTQLLLCQRAKAIFVRTHHSDEVDNQSVYVRNSKNDDFYKNPKKLNGLLKRMC